MGKYVLLNKNLVRSQVFAIINTFPVLTRWDECATLPLQVNLSLCWCCLFGSILQLGCFGITCFQTPRALLAACSSLPSLAGSFIQIIIFGCIALRIRFGATSSPRFGRGRRSGLIDFLIWFLLDILSTSCCYNSFLSSVTADVAWGRLIRINFLKEHKNNIVNINSLNT